MTPRILVTGGSGQLGGALAPLLKELGQRGEGARQDGRAGGGWRRWDKYG